MSPTWVVFVSSVITALIAAAVTYLASRTESGTTVKISNDKTIQSFLEKLLNRVATLEEEVRELRAENDGLRSDKYGLIEQIQAMKVIHDDDKEVYEDQIKNLNIRIASLEAQVG